MDIYRSEFVTSSVDSSNYPENKEIEFAFIGRSNVGKSSLINNLANRKNLARTSKTPGRTQLVNFFLLNSDFYFVDLPGYGFAKVPSYIKSKWGNIISSYLSSQREKVVFLLLDIRRTPSTEDMAMLEWLEYYGIEYYIIFTKVDKLSNNERFKSLKNIREKLIFENEDVFFHSSLKKKGREPIINYVFNTLIDKKS